MISLTKLRRTLVVSASVFALSLSLDALAAPSGGPYGPVEKTYDLPKAANIYYVAPNGDANASGKDLSSPTTLKAAIARVVSGDAVVLRGGVYRTGNLELNQGITMQPYLNEKPVLKGTKIAKDWQKSGDAAWSTTWSELFPSEPMYWWRREREEAKTPLHRFNNDMVFIDGEYLQSAGSIDELDEHTYFIDYDNETVYIGRDPKGHTVEITAHDVALLRTSGDVHGKTTDKKGPKIYGITFTQYAWTAFSIEGERSFTHLDEPVDEPIGVADPATYGKQAVGTLLENVTVSYNGRVGGYFRGDGLVIRNSMFTDSGTEGIYVIGSSDVLLERNVVMRNNIENITGYYASAVKIINQTHNVVVRDNLVMDHHNSAGVWYDIGNYNGVFINNYVENTDLGFFFEISQGAVAAGNVFVNNGNGTLILNSKDAEIYNNTYIDSPVEFRRDERSAEGDHFGWHPKTGPDVDERFGHIFMNNLMVASDTNTAMLRVVQAPALCQKLDVAPMKALDGNVYVRPAVQEAKPVSPIITWFDVSAASDDCATEFDTLAAFQQHGSPLAEHSQQLDGNPRSIFVAPDLSRFQLQRELNSHKDVSMPNEVRKYLDWSRKAASRSVGAYPSK